jgi:uncharacterized membrane protein YphA (DoxX/SURF4 family)
MKNNQKIIDWILRLVAAAIMLQTLYFKFSASPESVYIFTQVGMEPWGRIAMGVLELAASVLLLLNTTAWIGAGLGLGLMVGAIGMHLTMLGISIPNADGSNDGGQLFIYAVIVSMCSVGILLFRKALVFSLLRLRKA